MKCIVKDCQNHDHEGKFTGSLCSPCYRYITEGEGKYSQAFRNAQRQWVGLTDEHGYLLDALRTIAEGTYDAWSNGAQAQRTAIAAIEKYETAHGIKE